MKYDTFSESKSLSTICESGGRPSLRTSILYWLACLLKLLAQTEKERASERGRQARGKQRVGASIRRLSAKRKMRVDSKRELSAADGILRLQSVATVDSGGATLMRAFQMHPHFPWINCGGWKAIRLIV